MSFFIQKSLITSSEDCLQFVEILKNYEKK